MYIKKYHFALCAILWMIGGGGCQIPSNMPSSMEEDDQLDDGILMPQDQTPDDGSDDEGTSESDDSEEAGGEDEEQADSDDSVPETEDETDDEAVDQGVPDSGPEAVIPQSLPDPSESSLPLVVLDPAPASPRVSIADLSEQHGFDDIKSQLSTALPGTVYAHTNNTLYALDVLTHELRAVAVFGTQQSVTDLAIDSEGYIFALTSQHLLACDALDGECFRLGPASYGAVGLSFIPPTESGLSNDALVSISGPNWSEVVLTSDGTQVTSYGEMGTGINISGDVFSIVGTGTFAAVNNGSAQPSGPQIIRVDGATGAFQDIIYRLPSNIAIWGIAGWTDKIYLFSHIGHVLLIEPTTGELQNLGQVDLSFWGAGVSPVVRLE